MPFKEYTENEVTLGRPTISIRQYISSKFSPFRYFHSFSDSSLENKAEVLKNIGFLASEPWN